MPQEVRTRSLVERVSVPGPSEEACMPAMRIKLAVTFGERLRGLHGISPDDSVLLLVPCRDIHTFGMSYSLDVAFIDKRGFVLHAARDVAKGKRISCPGAYAAFERPAAPERPWLRAGQSANLFLGQDDVFDSKEGVSL